MAGILIVDDDPDVQKLLSIFLSKQGYEVSTALNKQEAIEKIKQEKPEALLLDVLLSGADGRIFCKEIKESKETNNLKVILFSAHPGVADSVAECGADDFLAKPVNLKVLEDIIQKHVST